MKTGPNIVNDGLVFGYDTHTYSRFYNGVNTTNHLISLRTSFTNTVRTNGKAVAGEEEVYIPTIGKRNVKYVEYFNNYNNGDDLGCCPNLFNYHGGTTVPLVGNQSYTYSIVYKHTGGYTHPNFMYRYRYKEDGTYIGEGGLHSTARRTHLGDGWYHAWGSWTTNSDANYGRFYSFLYNYGTTVQRFYVAAISLVKNNSGSEHLIIPPNLLLEPNTSVTSTQSLIDLKGNTNIDVDDISFNSTGQPEFDGTDDYVKTDAAIDLRSDYTLNWVFKGVGNSQSGATGYNTLSGNASNFRWLYAVSSAKILAQIGGGNNFSTIAAPRNQWNIASFTYDDSANERKWYINGVAAGTFSGNSNGKNLSMHVGNYNSNNYWMNGNIAIARAYNRVLSSTEILANFNAQKGRFGIT